MSTHQTTTRRAAVSVDELRRAWHAVQAGEFLASHHGARPDRIDQAADGPSPRSSSAPPPWAPSAGEVVLPVIGCLGSAGTSTLSLALATIAASTRSARVLECCNGTASGLAAASTAELGQHPSGWLRGTRNIESNPDHTVLIERPGAGVTAPDQVCTPTPSNETGKPWELTVVDVGWDLTQLMANQSWLADVVSCARSLVVVTMATVPGLRRLEATLELLEAQSRTNSDVRVVVAVALRSRRWPKSLRQSAGPRTRAHLRAGLVVDIPDDRRLADTGVDSAPLPRRLLAAAGAVTSVLDLSLQADSPPVSPLATEGVTS